MSQNAQLIKKDWGGLSVKEKVDVIGELFEAKRRQLQAVLGPDVDFERFRSVTMISLSSNPGLLDCTRGSLFGAIAIACKLNLEIDPQLGHCYLIPFNDRKRGVKECQFIIGYKGLVELARRSDRIKKIEARVVRDGDHFDYRYGIDPFIDHRPKLDSTGDVIAAYAIATFAKEDGSEERDKQIDIMSLGDIESIRSRSKAKDRGPWVTDFEEMAKKTVVRRLCKMLPLSPLAQSAVSVDEQDVRGRAADYGTNFGDVIDIPEAPRLEADEEFDEPHDLDELAEREEKKQAAKKKSTKRKAKTPEVVEKPEPVTTGEPTPSEVFFDSLMELVAEKRINEAHEMTARTHEAGKITDAERQKAIDYIADNSPAAAK